MKKYLLILAAVGMIAGLSSCKKDYTCTCTVSGTTLPVLIENASKSDADDVCDAAQTTYQVSDPSATCSLSAN
jgi:hypothetical protein